MARTIEDLTDKELHNFIKSYERENRKDGGKYSLAELHVERLRRSPAARPPRDILKFIVERSSSEPSGTVTYGTVWEYLMPGMPWKGNHSIKVVGNSLGAVIAYCVRNKLPIATTLVVQGTGSLSRRAIQNIYEESKLYGVDVGLVPEDFVRNEADKARQINVNRLP